MVAIQPHLDHVVQATESASDLVTTRKGSEGYSARGRRHRSSFLLFDCWTVRLFGLLDCLVCLNIPGGTGWNSGGYCRACSYSS